MKNIIQTTNLSKQFRMRTNTNIITGLFNPKWQYKDAVKDINLTIQIGESVAFLGPNGAGKTTTTKMLTGLIKASSGEANVLGYNPFERKPAFLKKIGLVMGNKASLNWDLTASQSFELLQKIYEVPALAHQERIDSLASMLKVKHVLTKQVRKLSLGERMKLELISSLLHDPDILFLDEPTIGLDIESKANVRKFLRHVHGQGKTILLTSHDMDDVAEVCDRVIVINKGVIMFDGTMALLNQQYSSEKFVKIEFDGKKPSTTDIARFGNLISEKHGRTILSMPKDDVMSNIATIGKTFSIRDVTIEAVPLEVIVNDLFHKE